MLFSGQRHHMASYESPAAYYSFVFNLPAGTDIFKLTDGLLRRDIAESAAIGGSTQLRFSYRLESKRRAQRQLREMATFEDVINGDQAFSSWARNHSRLAIWLLRKRLVKLRLRRSRQTPSPELASEFERLRKIADGIDNEMLDVGLFSGLASVVDGQLFAPSYLATAPYVRLKLGAIGIESASWSDSVLEVFLLLHRCGVAILTFAAVPGRKNTDELLKLAASKGAHLNRTTFPLSLGKLMALGDQVISDEQVSNDGQEWRDVVWKEPIPLQALFDGYAELICQLAIPGGGLEEWMCYTTIFVDGLHCCGSREKWLKRHSAELAGIVMRNTEYASTKRSIATDALVSDFALHEDSSDYFEESSALLIRWRFAKNIEQTSPERHFYTTALVEGELVRFWQLRMLEQRLSLAEWKPSNLEEIQRQLIAGLEEYRGSKVVFGTARDIENHLSERMGLDCTYRQILDRLDAIQRLMDTRSASVANRRSLLFAGISAAAAVLFGMSAISDLLDVASKVDVHRFPGIVARPLDHFARLGSNGKWELYLLLVATVCAASAVAFFTKVAIGHRSIAKPFGVEWTTISYGPRSSITLPKESEGDGGDNERVAEGETGQAGQP